MYDNKSLKVLEISKDESITSAGWQGFARCLRSPCSTLQCLQIDSCTLFDDGAVALALALSSNTTLTTLTLYVKDWNGAMFGDVLSQVLWDTSSIENTYNSNHTAYKLFVFPETDAILETRKLNKNKDKVEVARQKILRHHFDGGGNEIINDLFVGLPETGFPHALECIGRDGKELGLMYDFVKLFPAFFHIIPESGAKKRKL